MLTSKAHRKNLLLLKCDNYKQNTPQSAHIKVAGTADPTMIFSGHQEVHHAVYLSWVFAPLAWTQGLG